MCDWTVSEVLELVTKLNQELDEQDYVDVDFWLTTNGDSVVIELCGAGLREQIWDSWEDEREQITSLSVEDASELNPIEFYAKISAATVEPLEGFLRRRAHEVLEEVAKQAGYVKLQPPEVGADATTWGPPMDEKNAQMHCPGGEELFETEEEEQDHD